MADIDLDFNCGCRFKTKSSEEASRHSDTKRHIITVMGTVRPEFVEKEPERRSAREGKVTDDEFATLRRAIGKS